ncbi:MAG: arginase family protein, partial [Pirellulales bacterium]|nr:arginase family protein [Pirellulales bacterium]
MREDPSDDPQLKPRFGGIPTFMRAPLAENAEGLDIALVGVPFDGGVTNRPGARHGPRSVRDQSSMIRKMNQVTGIAPFDLCRVADIGDAWAERPFRLEDAHEEIEKHFQSIKTAGAIALAVGGDHSITLPIMRALATDGPVGMIHVDAHCDTGDDYYGSRFHHGAPFRRAVEEGLLDPARTIQIGIRGTLNDPDLWKFSYDSGMRVIPMEEFESLGMEAVIAEARRIAGDGPTYLSFDIDS